MDTWTLPSAQMTHGLTEHVAIVHMHELVLLDLGLLRITRQVMNFFDNFPSTDVRWDLEIHYSHTN